MRSKPITSLVIFTALLFSLSAAQAKVPEQINYQGFLTKPTGVPVDGDLEMMFAIYDAETGGTIIWEEGPMTVTVTEGVYNVILGQTVPITPDLLLEGSRWLEVVVEGEYLEPRELIVSSLFAIEAETANTAIEAGNADTVDGAHAAALEESAEIDADIEVHRLKSNAHHVPYTDAEAVAACDAAGMEETAEIVVGIAAHAAQQSVHHTKTRTFAALIDLATDAQIPNNITIDHAATAGVSDTADFATIAGNADTVDGVHADTLEESVEIVAGIAAHAAIADAHHAKTTSFAELTDSADDLQIPDDITIAHAAHADDADEAVNADTLDGHHEWYFSESTHDHAFTEITGFASDEQIPDDITIAHAATAGDSDYAATAGDADTLDGHDSSYFVSTYDDHGRSGVANDLYEGTVRLSSKYLSSTGPGVMMADTSSHTLSVSNFGSGNGISGFTFGDGDAIMGMAEGSGYAGYFTINNTANSLHALYAETNGTGDAIHAKNTGIYGHASFFSIDNTINSDAALYAMTSGTGNTIYAKNSGGSGHAGRFRIDNSGNSNSALYASTNGSGPALEVTANGSGPVGELYGGALKLYSNGVETIKLNPDGPSDGGKIMLFDAFEQTTVEITAAEGTGQGSTIKLYDFDNNKTIELDADLNGKGRVITDELEITGGSDLSEHFDIKEISEEIEAGMVVSIDPERPGSLALSREAYDRKVAGIVSGAGGIDTGLMLRQKGSVADGSHPVALTGRVYCWADASSGPIRPGDLLTTSGTRGHAMKVEAYEKAQGAILGKAMSALGEGRGLVLVLVALQ